MKKYIELFNKKMNKKILLSYFLVFFVPFLVLLVSLVINVSRTTKKELVLENEKTLAEASIKLERIFTQLDEIAIDMSLNNQIEKPNRQIYLFDTDIETQMRRYVAISKIIDNLYVYYPGQDKIYSMTGTLSEEVFLSIRYKTEGFTEPVFHQLLNEEKPRLVRMNENSAHLFYFIPFVMNGQTIGRVIFSIPMENMIQNLNIEENILQQFLFYSQGRFLFSTGSFLVKEGYLEKTFEEEVAKQKAQELLGKTKEIIPSIDLTGISLMNKELIYQKIRPIILWTLLLLACFLFMGIIVVFVLSYRQYQPTYHLNRLYRELSNQEKIDENDNLNDLGDYLFHTQISLKTQKERSEELQRRIFWEHLLLGALYEEQEILQEAQNLEIGYVENHAYLVAVASSDISSDYEENLKMKTVLMNQFPIANEHFTVDVVEFPQKKVFAFIFFFDEEMQEKDALGEYFSSIVQETLRKELLIFYGTKEKYLSQANVSYLKAVSAKENANKQLTSKHEGDVLLDEKIETLIQAVKIGNVNSIEWIISELVEEEKLQNLSQAMSEKYYRHVIEELENASQIKAFVDNNPLGVLHFAKTLAGDYAQVIQDEQKENRALILSIIEENFEDPMFCLDEMALKFDVSLSKMSQMIKQETGISFSKYVQELRIEKAKELLVHTNKPVKEIVMDIGYSDIPNFTRKFRESVGLPPGQYRKKYSKVSSV